MLKHLSKINPVSIMRRKQLIFKTFQPIMARRPKPQYFNLLCVDLMTKNFKFSFK